MIGGDEVRKSEGKRPLGRPRRRWVDNIKMYLGEIEWGGLDWISMVQDRERLRALMNSVMNLRVPLNAETISGFITSGLPSSGQLHRVS
jgi:hypothetical protein